MRAGNQRRTRQLAEPRTRQLAEPRTQLDWCEARIATAAAKAVGAVHREMSLEQI